MQFLFWFGAGMGLVFLLGWLTIRFLLQKAFFHSPVPQTVDPGSFNLSYTEVFLDTVNRKKIQVLSVGKDNTGPLVICIHGWENTAEKFFPMAKFLEQHNYRLLLVNTRNHGASDTDGYSTMIQFGQDLDVVYRYAQKIVTPTTSLVLVGHSLGGATVLYKSKHFEQLTAVVSIASFADLRNILSESFLRRHFPRQLLPAVLRYIELSVGDRFENLSPHETIRKVEPPVLLLHGNKDRVVPVQAIFQLQKAAQGRNVTSMVVPDADHSSLLNDQNTFESIHSFLLKHANSH